MAKYLHLCVPAFLLALTFVTTSCEREDPGPLQDSERDYTETDFDRLEMGNAFRVTVEESSIYSIHIRGDRRNLDDLDVHKSGSTLIIRFDKDGSRKHDTHIDITMPKLRAANFSGASVPIIKGFNEPEDALDLFLSGATKAQLDATYNRVKTVLSGASELIMTGEADALDTELSGASVLSAFSFPVRTATLNAAGASSGQVRVSEELNAVASGSSSILYRGDPEVNADTSGNSSVNQD
ncbi:DUF2807 domain-containing protein [Fulvivirgaceae bacterium PWU5]|uniref:DUF2807 domain-containing protein n=1 Tax=Dawidia cretensis TaxID=2782350 RepID=A0AAP2E2A1_9BACT|nr:head GIN domain-containing protein [Dawidia cretensis]MBT1710272.1 DUF2807 domain-containing protein [Dawidia cretensis]